MTSPCRRMPSSPDGSIPPDRTPAPGIRPQPSPDAPPPSAFPPAPPGPPETEPERRFANLFSSRSSGSPSAPGLQPCPFPAASSRAFCAGLKHAGLTCFPCHPAAAHHVQPSATARRLPSASLFCLSRPVRLQPPLRGCAPSPAAEPDPSSRKTFAVSRKRTGMSAGMRRPVRADGTAPPEAPPAPRRPASQPIHQFFMGGVLPQEPER